MGNERTSNVLKNSSAGLIYKVSHIFFKFVMRTIFIHFLGNEYTGVSGLFTDILSVLSLMELGLDNSMIYALYSPVAKKDTYRVNALMNFYRKAFTCIGILVLVMGGLCVPFLQYIVKDVPNIKEDIRLIFMMYVATSASSYFLVYKTILLKADQKSRIITWWNTIVEISESLLEIFFLFILKEFFAYLIIHFLAMWIKNIYISSKSKKMYPEYFSISDARLESVDKRRLIRDIACLTVYTLSGVVINSTDSIFIAAFVGTIEVAIIGNFTLIVSSVRTCVQQVYGAAKPSIGNLAATSSTDKQEMVFKRMDFVCFWITSLCTVCLFTLMNPFVGDIWLQDSYKTSVAVIATLSINFYISAMVYPVESFRTANGLFVQGWYRPALMAVLNIILDFFLGKRWGIIGIFLATTISRVTTQVWFDAFLVYKFVFQKSPWKYYLTYTAQAAITALICFLCGFLISLITIENNVICFILQMIIAVVVPNVIIVLLNFRREEFSYARDLIIKLLKKVTRYMGIKKKKNKGERI